MTIHNYTLARAGMETRKDLVAADEDVLDRHGNQIYVKPGTLERVAEQEGGELLQRPTQREVTTVSYVLEFRSDSGKPHIYEDVDPQVWMTVSGVGGCNTGERLRVEVEDGQVVGLEDA